MTPAEVIGLIASLIAIFEVGYFVGKRRENKRRQAKLDEAVAARIREVLGLTSDHHEALPGQTIQISFNILSKATFPYQTWLGASIVDASGTEYYDQSEDKEITLDPGRTAQFRYLTVPNEARTGSYSLHGGVWLGARATPADSLRLAVAKSSSLLEVKGKV
jgi:hypothetical protein